MLIRKAGEGDAEALIALYGQHLAVRPPDGEVDAPRWREKLREWKADAHYHLLVGEEDGQILASVTLVIIENLTHQMRPYALIENVVTHAEHRRQGRASALMGKACELARESGCYKIMLLTGSKQEGTLNFYRRCGFNSEDKTGFVKWFA